MHGQKDTQTVGNNTCFARHG